MKLIEVIDGMLTSEQTHQTILELSTQLKNTSKRKRITRICS
nr:hypothetical protein [Romboutsia lituseburensis]